VRRSHLFAPSAWISTKEGANMIRADLRSVAMAVLAALGLSGCAATNNGSEETVTLSSATSGGETGTATLTSTGTSATEVSLVTTGGSDTGVQSAAIYSGACGAGGTLFAELNNVQGEASVTTIATAFSSLTGSQYSIQVHSSTSIAVIEACGEIP
jgi:hypothetical protein